MSIKEIINWRYRLSILKTKYYIDLFKIELRYHKRVLHNRFLTKRRKIKYLLLSMARRCDGKGDMCNGGWAYLAHSNCAYVDELSNYNFCCKQCHEEINKNYQEMWDEYNAGRF